MNESITTITDVQRQILGFIKEVGPSSIKEIAEQFGVSYEAARQQMKLLFASALIEESRRKSHAGLGRPTKRFVLSLRGNQLFPKKYEELIVDILDSLPDAFGNNAFEQILVKMTEKQIAEWEDKLEGKTIEEKLALLSEIYRQDDPFIELVPAGTGQDPMLIEKNCPFLDIALKRPEICSVTISTMSRLLGYEIVREDRFQNGDGRCVFRVSMNKPISANANPFVLEEAG